jgi:hypothetical protein
MQDQRALKELTHLPRLTTHLVEEVMAVRHLVAVRLAEAPAALQIVARLAAVQVVEDHQEAAGNYFDTHLRTSNEIQEYIISYRHIIACKFGLCSIH